MIRKWFVSRHPLDGSWLASDYSGSARDFDTWREAFDFAFGAATWPQIGDCS